MGLDKLRRTSPTHQRSSSQQRQASPSPASHSHNHHHHHHHHQQHNSHNSSHSTHHSSHTSHHSNKSRFSHTDNKESHHHNIDSEERRHLEFSEMKPPQISIPSKQPLIALPQLQQQISTLSSASQQVQGQAPQVQQQQLPQQQQQQQQALIQMQIEPIMNNTTGLSISQQPPISSTFSKDESTLQKETLTFTSQMSHASSSVESSKNDFDSSIAVVFKEKHKEDTSTNDIHRASGSHRKVLIICTGGTIGMFQTENGLAVKKGFFEKFLREDSYFCDSDYTYFHGSDDFLITPLSNYSQRIWYKVHELDDPIDSTNMNITYYDTIATIVEKNYDDYDAFVILHGTDTMAYTASALSFMFENLSKTVILTGSQIPCSFMRNDGFNNLLCSLTIAGHFTIPEVLVCFNEKLFRGNRCTKMDSSAMDSFDSPNFEPLATFKLAIKIKWDKVLRRDPLSKFVVHKNLCDKIAIIKMHPFISQDTLSAIITNTETKGIIIETYGAGNFPTNRPNLISLLQKAYESGKVIVNLSQCYRSNVISIYETGQALLKLGVVCGWDCTTEAMASKLGFLLSRGDSIDNVRRLIQKNLRGEISPPIENDIFEFQQEHFIQALNDALQYQSNQKIDILRSLILPNIVCYMSKFGFHHGMEQLKSYGISFEKGDYDNRTGLHIAAREGQLECIKFLIRQCKDVNILDKFGRSPLFEAILNRHREVIVELIRAGGKIEAPKSTLTSLLMEAVKNGDQEILDIFLQAGLTDWNQFHTIDKRNMGHVAATFRQADIIRFLKYSCKFKFQEKDRWGKTALDEAKKRDFKEICKILQ